MTPSEFDRYCDEYLAALNGDDFDALEQLWNVAGQHPELEQAFDELTAELNRLEAEVPTAALSDAVTKHLPSAMIDVGKTGPVTLADAAALIGRAQPTTDELTAKLRSQTVAIPAELSLPQFIAWLEPQFGTAPKAYWKALYEAALQADLQRATETEYQLAARRPRSTP